MSGHEQAGRRGRHTVALATTIIAGVMSVPLVLLALTRSGGASALPLILALLLLAVVVTRRVVRR